MNDSMKEAVDAALAVRSSYLPANSQQRPSSTKLVEECVYAAGSYESDAETRPMPTNRARSGNDTKSLNICRGLCSRIDGYQAKTQRTRFTAHLNFCTLCTCVLPDNPCRCCRHKVRTTPSHVIRKGRNRPDHRKRID